MQYNSILDSREKRLPGYSYKLNQGNQYGMDVTIPELLDLDESTMSVWIPFADGNRRDGVGDLLEIGGINVERHKKNPIVLFDHGKQVALPIAMAEDPANREYSVILDPANKSARCKAFFYQGKGIEGIDRQVGYDHGVFCEQLYDLIAKRYIRSGSIGYQVIQAKELYPDFEKGIQKGLHLLNTLLLECSAVVLPANQDTVVKMLSMPKICGKNISPYLVKSLIPYMPQKKAQLGYEKKSEPRVIYSSEVVENQGEPRRFELRQKFPGQESTRINYARHLNSSAEATETLNEWQEDDDSDDIEYEDNAKGKKLKSIRAMYRKKLPTKNKMAVIRPAVDAGVRAFHGLNDQFEKDPNLLPGNELSFNSYLRANTALNNHLFNNDVEYTDEDWADSSRELNRHMIDSSADREEANKYPAPPVTKKIKKLVLKKAYGSEFKGKLDKPSNSPAARTPRPNSNTSKNTQNVQNNQNSNNQNMNSKKSFSRSLYRRKSIEQDVEKYRGLLSQYQNALNHPNLSENARIFVLDKMKELGQRIEQLSPELIINPSTGDMAGKLNNPVGLVEELGTPYDLSSRKQNTINRSARKKPQEIPYSEVEEGQEFGEDTLPPVRANEIEYKNGTTPPPVRNKKIKKLVLKKKLPDTGEKGSRQRRVVREANDIARNNQGPKANIHNTWVTPDNAHSINDTTGENLDQIRSLATGRLISGDFNIQNFNNEGKAEYREELGVAPVTDNSGRKKRRKVRNAEAREVSGENEARQVQQLLKRDRRDNSDLENLEAQKLIDNLRNDPKKIVRDIRNRPVRKEPKSLLNIQTKGFDRKKYRNIKDLRRVLKSSSPGSSIVFVRNDDLDSVKQESEKFGLKLNIMGSHKNLHKLKLTGDDQHIESIAKNFGRLIRTRHDEENVAPDGLHMQTKVSHKSLPNSGKKGRIVVVSPVNNTTHAIINREQIPDRNYATDDDAVRNVSYMSGATNEEVMSQANRSHRAGMPRPYKHDPKTGEYVEEYLHIPENDTDTENGLVASDLDDHSIHRNKREQEIVAAEAAKYPDEKKSLRKLYRGKQLRTKKKMAIHQPTVDKAVEKYKEGRKEGQGHYNASDRGYAEVDATNRNLNHQDFHDTSEEYGNKIPYARVIDPATGDMYDNTVHQIPFGEDQIPDDLTSVNRNINELPGEGNWYNDGDVFYSEHPDFETEGKPFPDEYHLNELKNLFSMARDGQIEGEDVSGIMAEIKERMEQLRSDSRYAGLVDNWEDRFNQSVEKSRNSKLLPKSKKIKKLVPKKKMAVRNDLVSQGMDRYQQLLDEGQEENPRRETMRGLHDNFGNAVIGTEQEEDYIDTWEDLNTNLHEQDSARRQIQEWKRQKAEKENNQPPQTKKIKKLVVKRKMAVDPQRVAEGMRHYSRTRREGVPDEIAHEESLDSIDDLMGDDYRNSRDELERRIEKIYRHHQDKTPGE